MVCELEGARTSLLLSARTIPNVQFTNKKEPIFIDICLRTSLIRIFTNFSNCSFTHFILPFLGYKADWTHQTFISLFQFLHIISCILRSDSKPYNFDGINVSRRHWMRVNFSIFGNDFQITFSHLFLLLELIHFSFFQNVYRRKRTKALNGPYLLNRKKRRHLFLLGVSNFS